MTGVSCQQADKTRVGSMPLRLAFSALVASLLTAEYSRSFSPATSGAIDCKDKEALIMLSRETGEVGGNGTGRENGGLSRRE